MEFMMMSMVSSHPLDSTPSPMLRDNEAAFEQSIVTGLVRQYDYTLTTSAL